MGRLYANLQDWPASIQAFRPVLRAQPDDLEALRTASGAFMMLGYQSAALTLAKRACRLQPSSADYHRHLGHLLNDMGEPAAAKQHLDRAVLLQTGSTLRGPTSKLSD